MSFLTRIGLALAWLVGIALTVIGVCKNDPILTALRGSANIAIAIASLVVVAALVWRGGWRHGWARRSLIVLWCLPSSSMLGAEISFLVRKHAVLATEPALARTLGQHFVVGYTSFDEVALLAEKGLIGGVYVTKHNVAGRPIDAVNAELSALQDRRHAAGLPPLMVAADQEGGVVSHLSPMLSAMPALSTLAELPHVERVRKAEELGRAQGREMAALGVNTNFAPVLDLRPETKQAGFDLNTLIERRAISGDPAVVADVALAYVHGLEASGVSATVKHFPGLGRVRSDTHLFSADLGTPRDVLEASDWRPFREVLAGSHARLMIGHVSLSAIDPGRPASHSKRIIDGIIRGQWHYDGVIITDDFVMGAIYGHGVCTAVVEALNAGADLLLVAFDGAQFYRIFACATDAAALGTLDSAALRASEARLQRNVPPGSREPISLNAAAQPAGE
jgi:beta-N-acetylhexosaminidase